MESDSIVLDTPSTQELPAVENQGKNREDQVDCTGCILVGKGCIIERLNLLATHGRKAVRGALGKVSDMNTWDALAQQIETNPCISEGNRALIQREFINAEHRNKHRDMLPHEKRVALDS